MSNIVVIKQELNEDASMLAITENFHYVLTRFLGYKGEMPPLKKVEYKMLAMVAEWCENQVRKDTRKQQHFVEGLDVETLLVLLKTANYIGIKELGDQMREAISERARRKALEELDQRFLHARI